MADKEKTYHDYVIKDGKFIGRFDEMYSEFTDPWTQSSQPNKYSRMAGILHLKNFHVKRVLECGCGLGYYADWIQRETGITPKSVDISPVAIEKAKKLFHSSTLRSWIFAPIFTNSKPTTACSLPKLSGTSSPT